MVLLDLEMKKYNLGIWRLFLVLLVISNFIACKESKHQRLARTVLEWENKQIRYPSNMLLTNLNGDSTAFDKTGYKYTIMMYVDSIGCMSCKLQLKEWKLFVEKMNIENPNTVCILLVFHSSNKRNIRHLLKKNAFNYPVFFDIQDSLNLLNHFPIDDSFRSFLLDRDNKVVIIGNPIHNPNIKKLYEKIICSKSLDYNEKRAQTQVQFDQSLVNLGNFKKKNKQELTFVLKNLGHNLLSVEDVVPSCDCLDVRFTHESTNPGDTWMLNVIYEADAPGAFEKTIAVYCNVPNSPLHLRIMGYVE